MRWLLTMLVRAYQVLISPLLGPSCRYYPSCSAYAVTALERHGALRGSWLALRRLGRCHPWTPGGVDLVPALQDYRWWGRCPGSEPTESDAAPAESRDEGTTQVSASASEHAPEGA